MVVIKEGNILNVTQGVICHQVNCQGVMGAGLAKQIRNKWPKVYEEYKHTCNIFNEKNLPLLGEICLVDVEDKLWVSNLFAQDGYGHDKCYTNYWALRHSLLTTKESFPSEITIHIPYGIGCGLAGGDWDKVYQIIKNTFDERNVIIWKLKEN